MIRLARHVVSRDWPNCAYIQQVPRGKGAWNNNWIGGIDECPAGIPCKVSDPWVRTRTKDSLSSRHLVLECFAAADGWLAAATG